MRAHAMAVRLSLASALALLGGAGSRWAQVGRSVASCARFFSARSLPSARISGNALAYFPPRRRFFNVRSHSGPQRLRHVGRDAVLEGAAAPTNDAPFPVYEPFGQLFESRPEGGADSAVIWLHAGGGNGAFSFYTVGAELRQALPSTALIFPTGKMRLPFPRWINFGFNEVNVVLANTSALVEFGGVEGLDESIEYAHALVEHEIGRGIKPERILLAGFSQGGAVALVAGLTARVQLGGILGLSTFFLGAVPAAAQMVPVHLFHGDADPVVPLPWAEHSKNVLESAGVNASLRVYPGLWHSRSMEENRDVVTIIEDLLASPDGVKTTTA